MIKNTIICHDRGSLMVLDFEHKKITRKDQELNKNTRNVITRRLELQDSEDHWR